MIALFGWLSEIFSLAGVWLAGRSRLGWVVGLIGSMCWFTYGVMLSQPPLWVGAICYIIVNVRNWFIDLRK